MLRADLAAARAAWVAEVEADPEEQKRREGPGFLRYQDGEGRCADFHALRHTFITRLVKAGVKPKEAQARHSTITLTIDRYAHTGLRDVARAVEALPPTTSRTFEALRATGTDGPVRRLHKSCTRG
jgi:hypothetical protein